MLDALAAKGILDELAEPPTVIVSGTDTVEVRLARRVPHIFAKALPGARPTTSWCGRPSPPGSSSAISGTAAPLKRSAP